MLSGSCCKWADSLTLSSPHISINIIVQHFAWKVKIEFYEIDFVRIFHTFSEIHDLSSWQQFIWSAIEQVFYALQVVMCVISYLFLSFSVHLMLLHLTQITYDDQLPMTRFFIGFKSRVSLFVFFSFWAKPHVVCLKNDKNFSRSIFERVKQTEIIQSQLLSKTSMPVLNIYFN